MPRAADAYAPLWGGADEAAESLERDAGRALPAAESTLTPPRPAPDRSASFTIATKQGGQLGPFADVLLAMQALKRQPAGARMFDQWGRLCSGRHKQEATATARRKVAERVSGWRAERAAKREAGGE